MIRGADTSGADGSRLTYRRTIDDTCQSRIGPAIYAHAPILSPSISAVEERTPVITTTGISGCRE